VHHVGILYDQPSIYLYSGPVHATHTFKLAVKYK